MDISTAREKIVSFIRDYVEGNCGGVIVGLSGGLDSAVTAALCAEAIGIEAVDLIALPYRTSAPSSLADAQRIAEHLAGELEVMDISAPVDAMVNLAGGTDKLRLGNIAARMRMIILYDISAVRGKLVAGTGNRTERHLGYSTLWGDMACAFTPIGGLLKTQERLLAREIGLPEWVIEKTPTADLWQGQTDEGEMGITYKTADEIIFAIHDEAISREELIARGISQKDIDLVLERERKYEFKRRMPAYPELPGLPL